MRVEFMPCNEILDPKAVVGRGAAARALGERLLALEDERLAGLRGAAGSGILIAIGEAEDLPWADGVTYLGRDPDAPRLLLPTMLRPHVALNVFERAIARHAAALSPPWAILASPPIIVSVASAAPIDRAQIEKWLGQKQ